MMSCSQMGRQNTASLKKVMLSLRQDGINGWRWGNGEEAGKRFSGDLFNQMARGGRKIISVELSFIYLACDLLKPEWPN